MDAKLKSFLQKHNFVQDDADEKIRDYIKKAKLGLRKDDAGPFEMIPTYISPEGELPLNESVIVIDAGGTNLRIALVRFNDNSECVTEKIAIYPMLGTNGAITAEQFFDGLAEYLEPFARECRLISFVFSFPCDITEKLDGRIITFDKEVQIPDAPGHLISVDLNKALKKRGLEGEWRVIILNDTISTLMGGKGFAQNNDCNKLMGIILGTGMNIAYVQNNKGIIKSRSISATSGSMCINMEAGGYDGFTKSDFDITVQNKAELPGHMQFEKMVSGVYQGMVMEEMLKCAAREGLFTEKTAEEVLRLENLEGIDADRYVRDPDGDSKLSKTVSIEDRQYVYELIENFYDRSARLIAITLTATMLLENDGLPANRPVCIVADGSTFYKTLLFKPKLEKYMEEIAARYNQKYMFYKVEDGNISGAAAAGLINR